MKRKPRDLFVHYRVNEEEYAKICDRANQAGMTLSHFARALLLSNPSPGMSPKGEGCPCDLVFSVSPEAKALTELAEQARRLGVNLNQIAHVMNMLRVPPPPELRPLLNDLRRFMEFVFARQGL